MITRMVCNCSLVSFVLSSFALALRVPEAVYSIRCNDCDLECIGQTKRQFGAHLKEQQKEIFVLYGLLAYYFW